MTSGSQSMRRLYLLSALSLGMMLGCSRPAGPVSPPAPVRTPTVEAAPTPLPATVPAPAEKLVSSQVLVEGIGLGSSEAAVLKALGAPESIEKAPQQQLQFYLYPKRGITVGISSDQRVHILEVEAPYAGATANGLRLGDSVKQLVSLYGPYQRAPKYVLAPEVTMTVGLDAERVTSLYVNWQYQ